MCTHIWHVADWHVSVVVHCMNTERMQHVMGT
jgi:hypothetical protein